MTAIPEIYRNPSMMEHIGLIAKSYQRLLEKPLVNGCDEVTGEELTAVLWEAEAPIVAHGVQADPLFFFANRAALEAFESTLGQFVGMPSRLSAEAPLREERQALLDRVSKQGFVDDYSGMRISAKGRRFRMSGIVWNLIDGEGRLHGQAATFHPAS